MSVRFIHASTRKVYDSGLCDKNLNLLAHAQAIELDIGSRCGGHGACGGDRVKTSRKDLSPITDEEKNHLSAEELAGGWRLACQCFPQENGLSFEVEFLP